MPITLFTIMVLLIVFLFPGTTLATVFLIIASIFAVIIAALLLFVVMVVAMVDQINKDIKTVTEVDRFKKTVSESFKSITSMVSMAVIIAGAIYLDLIALPVIWMINLWCVISIKVMQRKWRKNK
jgi:hypothetical protein